jgi:hypothetical protein
MINAGRRQYMTVVTSGRGAKDWMATAWAVQKKIEALVMRLR